MIGTIVCPDCGRECEVKETKKGKPYYSCEECGTQHFYRTQEGIARLMKRVKRKPEPESKPKPEAKPGVERKQGGESMGWGLW